MKRYTSDDFKTFFARQLAAQELPSIDWELLEKYEHTDLRAELRKRLRIDAQDPNRMAFNFAGGAEGISLSDGRNVSASEAMKYAIANGQYSLLRALDIFETVFSKTTHHGQIFSEYFMDETPPPTDLNFPLAFKIYPAEATHIYFQFIFPRQINNGQVYNAVTGYIDRVLAENDIGPGPTNIDALTALSLISEGWQTMGEQIQDDILPPPDGPWKQGRPFH
jgi:hypothetical protein